MSLPPVHPTEAQRLEVLRSYDVLDSLPEQGLDEITALASQICNAPIALISLVDEKRQWFKSKVGFEATETSREASFCAHALESPDLLIVPDALQDARFLDNPLVTGQPEIRFYAGTPLSTPEGAALGALCVIDRVARALTPEQASALRILGRQVMTHLELRRQTRVLRESEERGRAIIESSLDGIVTMDHKDRITEFNPAAEKIFGRSRAEALGRDLADLIIPERLRESHRRGLARYLETGDAVVLNRHVEMTAMRADGSEFPIELTATRLGSTAPPLFTAFLRDITERMRAVESLRQSEQRYRTLFECAPDGILIADRESRYLDGNASICRMLGYTREEFIGLQASDIVREHERKNIEPTLSAIEREGEHHREWQFKRKDGTTFSAEVIVTEMPDGNLLGMIRDISERKRTEARFRRLVDSSAQGVFFFNVNGAITAANDAYVRMIGYTREDLEAGQISWIDITPPEYAAGDARGLAELAEKGVCKPLEKEYIAKDGTRVPVLLGAAVFEDCPDEGVCFVVDLTERKKLEQQFLRVQRMDSIGTLAGGIAHDLNNVLGPIMLSIGLLEARFTDPESQEVLAIIDGCARRGADMVRQVLSFAKGVDGQRIEVQVRHVIRDIETIAKETFLKHIVVQKVVPRDLWTVKGDPTQLHQVLLNLCVNSRDAMPQGGTLTISARNVTFDAQYAGLDLQAEPGPYIVIQVHDSGKGIPSNLIGKIFDPFFTTKGIGQGTGLGLSTSLAIVRSHGGFMRVESVQGKGTMFEVFLPAQTQISPAQAAEIEAEMPRGSGELILVVDDESTVRRITQQTLELFGYRALVASDGAEAVSIYASRGAEIAAVLTDMTMPVMDGAATIQVLRKMNPAVRIVAASGFLANQQLAHLDVTHFLPKPYAADALLKMLKLVLAG